MSYQVSVDMKPLQLHPLIADSSSSLIFIKLIVEGKPAPLPDAIRSWIRSLTSQHPNKIFQFLEDSAGTPRVQFLQVLVLVTSWKHSVVDSLFTGATSTATNAKTDSTNGPRASSRSASF